jgi:hypothetical protein
VQRCAGCWHCSCSLDTIGAPGHQVSETFGTPTETCVPRNGNVWFRAGPLSTKSFRPFLLSFVRNGPLESLPFVLKCSTTQLCTRSCSNKHTHTAKLCTRSCSNKHTHTPQFAPGSCRLTPCMSLAGFNAQTSLPNLANLGGRRTHTNFSQ